MSGPADEFRVERLIGIGCITSLGGFFGGGMMAVLIAKIVGWARGCEPDPGLPAFGRERDPQIIAFSTVLR